MYIENLICEAIGNYKGYGGKIMSAKIWEVAKALRKGMVQVIRDFQKMGVSVKSLTDVVTDNEMLELAEQYGRRDCVFPLISNEYIFELAKTWDEENILKLMPEFNKEEGFIEEDVVKRLAIISNCINEKSNRILCSEPTVRKPKAFQAIYLLGKGDRALQTVDAAYDFQVFLIPKSKEKIHDCIINSGGFSAVRIKINIEECMILVWADGKYYYEQAEFKRLKDKYYLNVEKHLEKYGLKAPVILKQQWNPQGLWKMCAYVQPGKNGFAFQDVVLWKKKYFGGKYANCKILFDRSRMKVSDGEIRNYFWRTDEKAETIQGNLLIRKEISERLN